jgi:hypothetical protein
MISIDLDDQLPVGVYIATSKNDGYVDYGPVTNIKYHPRMETLHIHPEAFVQVVGGFGKSTTGKPCDSGRSRRA